MKRHFFITGLPRSRTAWLANLFTTGPVVCFHDIHALGRSASDLLRMEMGTHVGISDPILTLNFEALANEFPGARWLYVERPREQCLDSLLRVSEGYFQNLDRGAVVRLFDRHEKAARLVKSSPLVRIVKFDELDNYGTISAAWYHLVPEEPFDAVRWRILSNFRVQEIPERKGFKTVCR